MDSSYKLNKYLQKMENCFDLNKKNIYQHKIEFYLNQKGGLSDTNTLIVFNSANIRGSNLEKILEEKSSEPSINEQMMSKSDLEKLLANKAYIVEENKNEASLFGSSILSGLFDKSFEFAPTLKTSNLTNDKINKIISEIKTIRNSVSKIKETSQSIKNDFTKNIEDINKIKTNYGTKETELKDASLPENILGCAEKIISKTDEVLILLNERNDKMNSLENEINVSNESIEEKLKSLDELLSKMNPYNSQITDITKQYNDSTKTFIDCITPENKIKLSAVYSTTNFESVAKEIKEKTKDKLKLDAYIICKLKSFGKNNLLRIGKI